MKTLARLMLFLIILGFWIGVFEFNTDTRQLSYHPNKANIFMTEMLQSAKKLTGFDTSIIEKEVNKVSNKLKN